MSADHVGKASFDASTIWLADLAWHSNDSELAETRLIEAHDWALTAKDKESLCWSELVHTRLCMSCDGQLDTVRKRLSNGLRIARDCGYGLFHIDLLLERARLHLLL